ncbi:MAG: zeta toxin family protein [Oxalobacter sp.]
MPRPPQIVVFAGPNGSGKTTLYKRFRHYSFLRELPYINPDEILVEKGLSALQAGAEALRLRQQFLAERKSFIFETTLSGNSEVKLILDARKAGYKINIIYVCLGDIRLNIMRVNVRVRKGGHDVPVSDIVRRELRSRQHFFELLPLANRACLIENSAFSSRILIIYREHHKFHITKHQPGWAAPFVDAFRARLVTDNPEEL